MDRLISLPELAEMLNKSKITIWRWWAKDKTLPAPIKINGRCIGWTSKSITEWLDKNGGL